MVALLSISAICSAAKYNSCKKPSITWNTKDAYLIVTDLTSFQQCWETYRQYCDYFTWYDGNHPYFRNTCILFKQNGEEEECEDCVSAATSCFCESPVACK